MDPGSSAYPFESLFFSVTRDADIVVFEFCSQLSKRLVDRVRARHPDLGQDAEDMAAGALTNILSVPLATHRHRSIHEFNAFCYQATDWHVAAERRKRTASKRDSRITETIEQEGIDERVSSKPPAPAGQRLDVLEALSILTPEERVVVVDHYLGGESLREVGLRFSPPKDENEVFKIKSRALKRLRDFI